MTTAFSTIYDALITRLTALLPNHARLPNAYRLEENNERMLEQGWALAIAPAGTNTARHLSSGGGSISVGFQLALTRKAFATEANAAAFATTDKDLLADFQTVFDDSNNNNLGIDGTGVLVNGYSGVVPVDAERGTFRALLVNISVEYFR
jgi:hypothetical protein